MNSFELSCTIFGESLMWEGSQQGDGRQVNISHPTWEPDTQNRYRTGIENLDRLTWAQQGSELRTMRLHYTSLSKILAEKPGVVMNNSNTINYLQEIDNMLIHLKQTFKYYTVSSLPVSPSVSPHPVLTSDIWIFLDLSEVTGHRQTLVRLILTDSSTLWAFTNSIALHWRFRKGNILNASPLLLTKFILFCLPSLKIEFNIQMDALINNADHLQLEVVKCLWQLSH